MARPASRPLPRLLRNEARLWLYGETADIVPDTLSGLGIGFALRKQGWPLVIDLSPDRAVVVTRLASALSIEIREGAEAPTDPPRHPGIRPDLCFSQSVKTKAPDKARNLQERLACGAYPEFQAWEKERGAKDCEARCSEGNWGCTLPANHQGDHVAGCGGHPAARWANERDK
jgi:hypothetical protein